MFKVEKNKFWLFFLGGAVFLIILFLFTLNMPFFWDGLTKSQRADWIYNNNFESLIVPNEINSGHPPLWIFLLAFSWKLFGKTLLVSRLLLLVVNLGVLYELLKLLKAFSISGLSLFVVSIACIEPTLIAQSTSLNNDMLLLYFSLLALNSILSSRPLILALAYTGLLFSNLRGIYMFGAFSIIHFIFTKKSFTDGHRNYAISYMIPIGLFALFAYLQYEALGWMIIKDNSHRKVTENSYSLFKNMLAFLKCYLDYGRLFVFVVLLMFIKTLVKLISTNNNFFKLIVCFFVISLVLFLGTVPFSNPIGDRYYIFGYILLMIVLANVISVLKLKRVYAFIVLIGLLTGHLWIYPSIISQSWDSSLAYLNYYPVKEKMESYIEKNKIATTEIGTRLPMHYEKYAYLSLDRNNSFADFNLNLNKYVYISNIDNGTKDDDIYEVTKKWNHVQTFSQLGVYISLYKNPDIKD